jgi:hypothetical protein
VVEVAAIAMMITIEVLHPQTSVKEKLIASEEQ